MRRSPAALATVLLATLLPSFARAIEVVGVDPAPYALARDPSFTITVTFDAVPSVPAGSVRLSGSMSGLHEPFVGLDGNELEIGSLSPAFFPGEIVHLNLSTSITGPTGTDPLSGGHYVAFTIASRSVAPDFSERTAFGSAERPYFIHGGDIDGDGTPDVAAPNEDDNSVSIFTNPFGDGDLVRQTEFGVGGRPSSIFGEDFDNDGDQDLATADITSGTLSVLLNRGDGTFDPASTYAAGAVTRQVHGGDFDGDNFVDLCVTSNGTDQVLVYLNDGAGLFPIVTPYAAGGSGPFAIRTGDIDGDGHLDFAVANHGAATVSIYLNGGGGAFALSGSRVVGTGPWCLNGNDLDGDGSFDLVTVASYANRLVVLLNDGAGVYRTTLEYPTGAFPLGVYAADLDGDGDVDATSSNFSGRSVNVFLNQGDGTMSLFDTLVLPEAGTYTWAHDLDGDGDLDLSTLDELADSVFVYRNGGTLVPIVPEEPGDGVPAPAIDAPRVELWPNPARSSGGTTVRAFGLLQGPGRVQLHVFAPGGRLVRTIGPVRGDEIVEATWDGRDAAGRKVASGRYVLVVEGAFRRVAAPLLVVR